MTRILLIVPMLTLLGAAPPSATTIPKSQPTRVVSPVPSTCAPIGSTADGPREAPQLKRLGELPGAQTYMAVYRTDEKGCLDPMPISERQGIRRP